MKIDFEFIEKWEPKYDEIAADEGEYNALVNRVNKDVKIYKSISLVVFERIINWKSPRAKGKIKLATMMLIRKLLDQLLTRNV